MTSGQVTIYPITYLKTRDDTRRNAPKLSLSADLQSGDHLPHHTIKHLIDVPKWKASREKVQKRTWSSYIQLKIGHGFFKSYLKRLPNYESAECFCHRNTIQNPTHLVLECSEYRADRVEAFEGLDNDQKSMEYLFNTKIGREKLFKFLEKTKIASKKWLLRSS